jgi:hypothetical protein
MKITKNVENSLLTLIFGFIFFLIIDPKAQALTLQINDAQELSKKENPNCPNLNAYELYLQYRVDTRLLQSRSHSEVMFKKMSLLAEKKLGSTSVPQDLQATLTVILQELSEQP